MTRDEAITILNCVEAHGSLVVKAKEMAIEALRQEPCEDCVSRQAVNEIINDIRDCISVDGYWAILERMKKLPPVNSQEPCEDCISRKALLDAIYQKEYGTDYYDGNMLNIPYIDLIKQMPSSSGKPNKSENPTGSTTKKCATCAYREIDGKPHEICKSCVCGNRYKQEPKKGHWIETAEEYYKAVNEYGGGVNDDTPYFVDDIACSECLSMFSVIDNETERFDCCPHCGARMEV